MQNTQPQAPAVPQKASTPANKPAANAKDAVLFNTEIVGKIIDKIDNSNDILVALSDNPTADELCAAIALTMMLDKMTKHATAIFSGRIPSNLNFLGPEKTLEPTTDSLQDFIITLNKEKADHLRYKVEGDFVKIFITPYRNQLTAEDLEFSRGDYNVDLVIAMDVANADDLDDALSEHGRIMHDAGTINITTGLPGKFGEVEWSDATASCVSEMITLLATQLKSEEPLVDATVATALLAGIMSATDRFGNERVTPSTMTIASKLMEIGADQRLIATNISAPPHEESEIELNRGASAQKSTGPNGETLNIMRQQEAPQQPSAPQQVAEPLREAPPSQPAAPVPPAPPVAPAIPEKPPEAPPPDTVAEQELEKIVTPPQPAAVGPIGSLMDELRAASEPQVAPSAGKDYGSIMEKELAEGLPSDNPAAVNAPEAPAAPETNHIPEMGYGQPPSGEPDTNAPDLDSNSYIVNKPKTVLQPLSATLPPPPEPAPSAEPVASPLPMPSAETLPPPPAPFDPNASPAAPPPAMPPVEFSPQSPEAPPPPPPSASVTPIAPAVPPTTPEPPSLGQQPAMQDQVYAPQVNDPSTFNLPTNL